jgi:hypothetical protein
MSVDETMKVIAKRYSQGTQWPRTEGVGGKAKGEKFNYGDCGLGFFSADSL